MPQMVHMLQKLEKVKVLDGYLDEKYRILADIYLVELKNILKQYETEKENPPLPRLTPPVAGRVRWVNNLIKRADEPMKVLRSRLNLLDVSYIYFN